MQLPCCAALCAFAVLGMAVLSRCVQADLYTWPLCLASFKNGQALCLLPLPPSHWRLPPSSVFLLPCLQLLGASKG